MSKDAPRKIPAPQPVRGTQDMLGDFADRFAHVVETFERVRRLYGFKRVEVPVIEPTAVFARSLGETTDVVSKEMYSFLDRGDESITLRPEFTAGIARAYITNGWQQFAPLKVATHGPLFRYERPQKGRYRQFHQLDAEVIGSDSPLADAELLVFADQLLKELGIAEGVTLQLNTLGDKESRQSWYSANTTHFSTHLSSLSEDSRIRLEKNVLRILDSKDPRDREIVSSAPRIDDHLTDEAAKRFDDVQSGLRAAGVKYDINPHLVRGLDYYRHTAFEFVTDRLGAQGTVLGGGRYDGLIETLGGPPTPAVGWAAGIERLAMLLDTTPTRQPARVSNRPEIALIPRGEGADVLAREILTELRRGGIAAEMHYSGSSKNRFEKAKRGLIPRLLDVELSEDAIGIVTIRDIQVGALSPEDIRDRLKKVVEERFDIASPHEAETAGLRPIWLVSRK